MTILSILDCALMHIAFPLMKTVFSIDFTHNFRVYLWLKSYFLGKNTLYLISASARQWPSFMVARICVTTVGVLGSSRVQKIKWAPHSHKQTVYVRETL